MSAWNFANMFSYQRLPFLASSGLAAVGSSLLYFKQNELIYPANLPAGARTQVPTPEQFRIENASSMHFPTPDGETLHAYLLRPPNPALKKNITLLTFHGNAGNVGHRLPIGKVLAESLGCHVFMVEYRGYGLSTGSPNEDGLTIDGQTALDFVRNHDELKKTKIVVYGQSLGGAVTIKLVHANQDVGDIAGVILENTFTSIRKLIPSVMPPAKFIASWCHQRWTSDEYMAKITNKNIPFLFLSGLRDEIVPPFMMKTLFETCPTRKAWKEFPNGDHNSTVAEAGYFDAIWSFLVQDVLAGMQSSNLSTGQTDVDKSELWS
jgi:abhydrolase domain-containing protein 13